MSAAVVELREVEQVFAGPPRTEALRGVSLVIEHGEYVAIVGRSGSGKTTLLNAIGLLGTPTRGQCLLMGTDVVAMQERDRDRLRAVHIGFVFQTIHLLGTRSALENVGLGLALAGVPRRERTQRGEAALALVGLAHRAHALARTLSGGEAQRVAIARAVAKEPALLVCDEPTGDLDSVTTQEILDRIDALRARRSLTVLVVTHDPAVAQRTDRILTMEDGRLRP